MTEAKADDDRQHATSAGASQDSTDLSAGATLRSARERQGVHIAMLAAAIKVSPRKLDALENDRYDELPDSTFTRALAQTVCRALKIDAAPVLAKLPLGRASALEHVSAGLNTPFRERPNRAESGTSLPPMPLVWGGVALLAAAAVVALWPADGLNLAGWWGGATATVDGATAKAAAAAPAGPAAAASAPGATDAAPSAPAPAASAAVSAVETVHSAPPIDLAQDPIKGASLVTTEESWVEVVDANGQTLLSRIVTPGETVNVDGALPMRVKAGNARGTQLVFRGQVLDLTPFTRDNVARVELK